MACALGWPSGMGIADGLYATDGRGISKAGEATTELCSRDAGGGAVEPELNWADSTESSLGAVKSCGVLGDSGADVPDSRRSARAEGYLGSKSGWLGCAIRAGAGERSLPSGGCGGAGGAAESMGWNDVEVGSAATSSCGSTA
jgi:hypothetical protein